MFSIIQSECLHLYCLSSAKRPLTPADRGCSSTYAAISQLLTVPLTLTLLCASAGARLAALLYQKYVLTLGWHVTLFPDVRVSTEERGSVTPTMAFLHSLLDGLQVCDCASQSKIPSPLLPSRPDFCIVNANFPDIKAQCQPTCLPTYNHRQLAYGRRNRPGLT